MVGRTCLLAPPASGETMTIFDKSKLLRMYRIADGSA